MSYPRSLQNLIESFKTLNGVGDKGAERYALEMLNKDENVTRNFAQTLIDIKEHIGYCKSCGDIIEVSNREERNTCECALCKDTTRDHSIVCVVQSSKDILAVEKTGEYKGSYFVLNGVIDARRGIMPEDVNIDRLVKRAESAKEIILATSTTVEGETTAMYISKLLKEIYPTLTVSRISRGLPIGSYLDYADEMTLIHAIEDRKNV